jgi:hypothetical protein
MAKITVDSKAVQAALKAQAVRVAKEGAPVVVVGFGTNYGLYVHEDLTKRHRVGQAKFLEQPARTFAREIGRVIAEAVARGATLAQGLLLGGLRLQREAQQLCPVDTGALRASAFTRQEK